MTAYGTKRTFRDVRYSVAIGGKAASFAHFETFRF
jgi:hypothetical protein